MKRHLTPDDEMGSLLQHRLQRVTTPVGETCADAETLAGYVDDGMSASERAEWEAHFATCAKCRRSLALMARLKETASPEWQSETSRDTATSGGSLWVWMPLAACVLVGAGLWFATRPADRRSGSFATTVTEQARDETAARAPAPQSPPPPPPTVPASGSTTAPVPAAAAPEVARKRRAASSDAHAKPSPSVIVEAEAKASKEEPFATAGMRRQPPAPSTQNASNAQNASNTQLASGPHAQQQAAQNAQNATNTPAAPGRPAQDTQAAADRRDAKQEAQSPSSTTQRVGAVASAAASSRAASGSGASGMVGRSAATGGAASGGASGGGVAAGTGGATGAGAAPKAAPAPEGSVAESVAVPSARKALKSVDTERDTLTPAERANGMLAIVMDPTTPTRRWRVFKFGNIEVSRDGGGTWANELRQPDVAFTAVASPAPGVCWVVGTKGGVRHLALDANSATVRAYAATDAAQSWQVRQVPTADDLVSVTASDALNAVVTTKSGVRFATIDGGKTWMLK